MRDAGIKGSIINISSIFGLTRVQSNGSLAYSSSKAGMHAMTTVMALDFGPYDIRVNAIAPSIFQSEITKDLFQQQWLKDVVKKILPLQFTATVDPALTEVIRYLMHDSSKYITGNIFIVDSGTTLPGVPIFSRLWVYCTAFGKNICLIALAYKESEVMYYILSKILLYQSKKRYIPPTFMSLHDYIYYVSDYLPSFIYFLCNLQIADQQLLRLVDQFLASHLETRYRILLSLNVHFPLQTGNKSSSTL